MNDDRDPLLDALLGEAVGGQTPPDLSHRILERWAAGAAPQEDLTVRPPCRESVGPTPPPVVQPPPVAVATAPPADAHAAAPAPAPAQRPAGHSARPALPIGWSFWAASVAVLVLGVLTGAYLLTLDDSEPQLPVAEQPSSSGGRPDQATDGRPPRDLQNEPDSKRPSSPRKQQVARDRRGRQTKPSAFEQPLPFAPDQQPKAPSPSLAGSSGSQRPAPLASTQIIARINRLIRASWKEGGVQPAPQATDAEFCRRLYLALVGRIPTVSELQEFVQSKRADKRDLLIARLQSGSQHRREYVENWTTFWANVLIGRTGGTRPGDRASREGLEQYLRQTLAQQTPYNRMVFELLTATGSARPGTADFNGAVNFLLAGMTEKAALATARTAQVFHGKHVRCVQCHNHPVNDSWKQKQFWELNAFFRQMKVRREGKDFKLVDGDYIGPGRRGSEEAEIYFERLDGVQKVAYPVFLDGTPIDRSGRLERVNRRRELAKLVTGSRDLSRALVNRMWSTFLHRGFTKPVDDMGKHNPASHPELLEHLADQFVAHDYDVDSLIRWIVGSEAFQLSSRIPTSGLAETQVGERPLFSRYYTRQMSPEAVYKSLMLAADLRSRQAEPGAHISAQRSWLSQFNRNMGTDEGDEQNMFDGNIRQSVIIMTSPIMQRAVSPSKGGVLHKVVTSKKMATDEKITHLFLAALSRKPSRRELAAVRRVVEANRGDEAAGLQDVWWALLNSNEFILDH